MSSGGNNDELKKVWQGHHRGMLHEVASWSSWEGISLTYVPTSAGFTGASQLHRLCALFPSHQHPFHPTNLTRFNNQYEVISCVVDEEGRTITEEIVLSALHQYRLDYILPAVDAQHSKFSMPFVIVAKYSADAPLLEQVRIYWDQATLLRQLGVFQMAFHNLIKAAGNSITFEHELDSLPIVDGMRVSRRLVHPTEHNCNQLLSLEALEVGSTSTNPQATQPIKKLSPIGGLDNIAEMVHQLPILSERSVAASRHVPQLKSSIFSPTVEEQPQPHSMRHVPAAHTSQFKLGDGSSEPVMPSMPMKKTSIFGNEHDEPAPMPRPSITLDPHRNESSVFQEPSGPFLPQLPLTERSRFESHVFSASPMKVDTAQRRVTPLQHQSQVFASVGEGGSIDKMESKLKTSTCPFSTDADVTQPANEPTSRKPSTRKDGHFHGSGFAFADEEAALPSFSGRRSDPQVNRTSMNYSPEDTTSIPRAINTRNQSQLQLGDDATSEPVVLSSRVLQPPGGRTSIFLE